MTIQQFFADKQIIVTGGAGSVGSQLVRTLRNLPVARVRVIDNNESDLFHLQQELSHDSRIQFLYCDITNGEEVQRAFSGMHYCFHAAALKHVFLSEQSPFSVVQTNIYGLNQVISAALRNQLNGLLFTSSDKAVNPTNVMGASKLMGEKLCTASNALSAGSHRCIFSSTRFGNVAGSRGSVIPLFVRQLAAGQPLSLTDLQMTRFFMTLDESVDLVIKSMTLATGGEIFITKMKVIRIVDLAQAMIRLLAPVFGRKPDQVEIREIGPRPGEKLWEEMNTPEEIRHTVDRDDFLIVLPALQSFSGKPAAFAEQQPGEQPARVYRSDQEPSLSLSEVERFLLQPGVLPDDLRARLK